MTTIRAVNKKNKSDNTNIEESKYQQKKNEINISELKNKVKTINDYVDKIDEIIKPIYDKEIYKLDKIINEVKTMKESARKNNIRMDQNKLEIILLDLIYEIGEVNERIERRALDVDIANSFYNSNLDRALLYTNENKEKENLTNASLQKAFANRIVEIDEYTKIVKNRIYKKIESKLSSSEKIFYGIKAILGNRY
ncbi:hypothetical protein [Senegalia massiliensis]|uniref:Uncharacterized protein n=1 Tax=Senegalia massiliensis TaxID=1720316 RepID=A0A845R1D8_9CLOT|nr:hypothetical protein [Senegalia massiliensis]NBI07536.1 hypothetical protein [Senegalia massiliensis]